MTNLKSLTALTLLLITTFASTAAGQSSRRGSAARRARRTTGAEAGPKRGVASSASPATKTPSGLTYMFIRHGTGQPVKAGDMVSVHYTGLLGDGTRFDSSLDRGQPLTFPVGAGRVIKGWDEGIALLRVGDQAILIIPPELGYGAAGVGGVIPPNATLIFIVEVVDTKAGSATGR